jgi:3-oxoacyl-[acyl-carrier protein] reductase
MLFSNAGAMAQGGDPAHGSRTFGSTCSAPSTRSRRAALARSQRREDRRRGLRHHFIDLGGAGRQRQLYGPIKAALIHMAKGLARQYAAKKIRVNVVSPGTVYFKGGIWNMVEQNMPKRYPGCAGAQPDRPHGDAAGNRQAAVFLASPASSFTTGSNLVVDGAISNRV